MNTSPRAPGRVIVPLVAVHAALDALAGQRPEAVLPLLETLAENNPGLADHLQEAIEGVRWRLNRQSKSNRDLVIEALELGPHTLKELARRTELTVSEARSELQRLLQECRVTSKRRRGLAGKGGDRKTLIYSLK
jgi:hypothetical protein